MILGIGLTILFLELTFLLFYTISSVLAPEIANVIVLFL